MDLGLSGARVVVTGGASNIGRAIVHEFAAEGARIVINDIDEPQAEKVRAEALERGAAAVELAIADMTTQQGADAAIGCAVTAWGGIDVLVNNAGIYVIAALADTTLEQWNRLFSINVTGVFLGAKHVAPYLAERGGGSIINLSSVAGLQGTPGHTLYGASKGAVRTMTKDLAAELAGQNIRVNSIHPTYVRTAMADYGAAVAGMTLDELGKRMSPLGRLAEPEDVANVIVFLAGEDSNYLTAAEFLVDGGGTSVLSL